MSITVYNQNDIGNLTCILSVDLVAVYSPKEWRGA